MYSNKFLESDWHWQLLRSEFRASVKASMPRAAVALAAWSPKLSKACYSPSLFLRTTFALPFLVRTSPGLPFIRNLYSKTIPHLQLPHQFWNKIFWPPMSRPHFPLLWSVAANALTWGCLAPGRLNRQAAEACADGGIGHSETVWQRPQVQTGFQTSKHILFFLSKPQSFFSLFVYGKNH